MYSKFQLAILIFSIFIFSGCSIKSYENENKIELLSKKLTHLSPNVDEMEANILAKEMVLYPKELAKKYELTSPPLFHNFLVNIGYKEKGLCYHWARDLLEKFKTLNIKSINLIQIIANKGEYDEHNALCAIAVGGKFDECVILDAWRNSSSLFFANIRDDKDYNWKPKRI